MDATINAARKSSTNLAIATLLIESTNEMQNRQTKFNDIATALGYSFEGEIKIGGNYVSTARHDNQIFISGQIPRVGSTVMVTGRVGEVVTLEQAQLAAKICAMRALALLAQALGSLEKIEKILRVTVYTQSAMDFTQQSEVADAASEIFHEVLGEAGKHTRTSVGVYQLPKNAAVELDLVAAVSA
jgi:enamine deaminase RidA (YjgF/YER057c/UK114 family)